MDFCILLLYPVNLPHLFMNSNSFLVASLGFSMYSIMPPTNSDTFIIPFQFVSLLFLRSTYGSEVKASTSNVGDRGSIPGSGRYPGKGNGNPLQ